VSERRVLALVDDLMFASRIEAARGDRPLRVVRVRSPEALLESCREAPPALVVLDLDAARLEPMRAAALVRAEVAGARIVGFVSHVHEEIARAGGEAGCDRVLARGAFVRELPGLMAEAAGG